MKKSVVLLSFLICLAGSMTIAAASYENNEYQRKSRAFSNLATRAYDEGEYDKAVEYANQSEENAILSAEFISAMIARSEAETLLFKAHTRLSWARGIKAEKFFPSAFSAADTAVSSADAQFSAGNWTKTRSLAELALSELSVVREILPLPSTYQVELWAESKDCFWNIAADPAVYGDPFMWEKLYEANKKALKRPNNPNLLMPDMILTIPSIKGEYREGLYNPSLKYEPLSSQVK